MRALAFALALLAGPAAAATLDLGNVAPGSGDVRLVFAEQVGPSLPYLGFARIQHEPGPIEVTAVGTGGRILAEARLELQLTPEVDAMLVLSGNGSPEFPYTLRLYDGTRDEEARFAKAGGSAVAIHHLAPYAGAEREDFEAVSTCRSPLSLAALSASIRVEHYADSATTLYANDGNFECSLKTADPRFGAFDLAVPQGAGTLRFLLVGDGIIEPARVLVLQDGAVSRVAGETAPAVGAVTRSEDFWYDLARPAQGVSLYEIPGSDDVFGTWFTHDAQGQPVWYLFDGVATEIPGQREMTVSRPSRVAGRVALAPAGSARLFYLDCNQAELRILLGDSDYVTLRIRRSRDVASCDALD